MIKTKKLYQVRYYSSETAFSVGVGYKQRLKPRADALRIAKRLNRFGVAAFISPMRINQLETAK